MSLLAVAMALPAAAYPRPAETGRLLGPGGVQINGGSREPAMSGDGRFVAFVSSATNLVPGDTNGKRDVFLHDRATGGVERVSVSSDGTEANDHTLSGPVVSGDGRYIAFQGHASNLVPDDTNGSPDIFLHDRVERTTVRISRAPDGSEANGGSVTPFITPDGRYVGYWSNATNLVEGDTNGFTDIFVHDRQDGTTERVSVASDGTQGDGRSWGLPGMSTDGRYVSFYSQATNLVPNDTNATWDAFVHDRVTGATERVSVATDGTQGNGQSAVPQLSADGRFVVFYSEASTLVPADTNAALDVFVRDRLLGTTERVSVSSEGVEANNNSYAFPAPVSADGRFVVFYGTASNLVPNDTNGTTDVFLHDRAAHTTERISVSATGDEGNAASLFTAISADGRQLSFYSDASTLVPGDTNGAADVFLRDRGPANGIGGLTAQDRPGSVDVRGWATFSGATLSSATDPDADGGTGATELGAEIVAASLLQRPEQEDVLLKIKLAELPGGDLGLLPGVLYRWRFRVGATSYEVRGSRVGVSSTAPGAPTFALYECAEDCTQRSSLSGGIGTTGAEVRVAVPMSAVGLGSGGKLEAMDASTSLGEATPGSLATIDALDVPTATTQTPTLELGVAPAGASQEHVPFTAVDIAAGRFSATLDRPSAPVRVWARACFAGGCGVRSVALGA